ncbi:hypothetical protein AV530_016648 [Patagioenas fasciata monilis]|uniref:Uncharacterized protein n=1 Tax=Patagioenas fasciata monilis TaxID=372326 RepID=A0A1V4J329_PATFA|nr:hypothetical protein AV530_016648 [Patagioenas fasciata monilis]
MGVSRDGVIHVLRKSIQPSITKPRARQRISGRAKLPEMQTPPMVQKAKGEVKQWDQQIGAQCRQAQHYGSTGMPTLDYDGISGSM